MVISEIELIMIYMIMNCKFHCRFHSTTWPFVRERCQEEILADNFSSRILSHSTCCSQRPQGRLLNPQFEMPPYKKVGS